MSAVLLAGVLAGLAGAQHPFPNRITLPPGWQPEGIAVSGQGLFYVGSIPTGAVYRGDLKTGQGSVLVPPHTDRAAIGMKTDRHGRLYVAGGPTGMAFVYDARTGADIAQYDLTDATQTFVNDVVVTDDGAYFTDSINQVLYRIPIAKNGAPASSAEEIPLTGDLVYQQGFNLNGIDATPNGRTLIVVQSNTGKLFKVDPSTGVTDQIELDHGNTLTFGDGLLLDGNKLYVVRNQQDRIALVRLRDGLASGSVLDYLRGRLDVPTTLAEFRNSLYAVNARFTTPPTSTTPYWITRLDKRH
ncbi:MAG TPA: SMP-30/gluconolactonase/LRE family protein [Gaiellaceae bacterium]|nr:SMP-30/gluconolactonase/LRE family protein [Gaiellaceae bacterium]